MTGFFVIIFQSLLEETCSVILYLSLFHHYRNEHLGRILCHLGITCLCIFLSEEPYPPVLHSLLRLQL